MSADIAIKVENLTKVYRLYNSPADRLKEALHPLRRLYHHDFYALNDVSFDIRQGEAVGIIGKNGSGKSTLLKILTGVLTPTSGKVQVNGKVSALLELGAGFNPELTGIENIYFNGMLLGYTREEMDERIEDILSFADIGEFVYQPVKTYSSGMFVRLAFAVSINVSPDILVVDEALAVGDELFQAKCYAKLRKTIESGTTLLLVTHSHQTVSQICNKAVLLDKGKLISTGEPKNIISIYHKIIYADHIADEEVQINSCQFNDVNTVNDIVEDNIDEHVYDDYLPTYMSKSAYSFRSHGVDIDNIIILNAHSKQVNVLTTGYNYVITYDVAFNEDIENIYFGMCIKTSTGIEIGWYSPPVADYIQRVYAGDRYQIKWYFKCSLLNGSYFLNTSVYGYNNHEFVFYNRITDALAFKVETDPQSATKGIVSFEQRPEIIKYENFK